MIDSRSPLGKISKTASCVLLAYWALYAAVTPITNIDSQIYNLARVELAARGGLFNNGLFTSAYHVMHPWTYDALHLPFLAIGCGYALPSFLCLVGTCYIVQMMMQSKFGWDAAWVAVLALLGLACLVYQGTSTKNDIPMVFCGAIWAYARWRWHREARNYHLIWMVLAIGFMAGSKTTGVLYGVVLVGWTMWELRFRRRLQMLVVAGLAGAFVFLGSVETYIESTRLFGHPLGPHKIVQNWKNSDGLSGGIANLTRNIAGSIYVGSGNSVESAELTKIIAKTEIRLLDSMGLRLAGLEPRLREVGLNPQNGDKTLSLLQSGFEELSGFGPIGTLAMATMLMSCFLWRPKAVWWKLAAIGLLGLVLVSFTVAYTEWIRRFLIGFYALGSIAFVCILWENKVMSHWLLRWGFMLLALASAVAAPALSFNRGPSAIIAAVCNRDEFETCNYPLIGKLRERLRVLREKNPQSHVYYLVNDNSLILPIIEDPRLDAVLITPTQMESTRGQLAPGDFIIVGLAINPLVIAPIEKISAPNIFACNQVVTQGIYQVPVPPEKSQNENRTLKQGD